MPVRYIKNYFGSKYNRSRRRYNYRRMQRGRISSRRGLVTRMSPFRPFFFKLRGNFDITTTGAGAFAGVFSLTNPAAFDGTNPVQDWTSTGALFDSYRVYGIKIQYVSHFPNDYSTATGGTRLNQNIYMVMDPDDMTALANTNDAIQYENLRIAQIQRNFKYFWRVPKYGAGSTAGVVMNDGYMNIANPQVTGGIKFWIEAGGATSNIGKLIITYYLGFKHRR